MAIGGLLAVVVGLPLTVFLLLMAAFAANPCGAFADGCDSYGRTGAGTDWFANGAVMSTLIVVGGIAMVAVAGVRHYRRNHGATPETPPGPTS